MVNQSCRTIHRFLPLDNFVIFLSREQHLLTQSTSALAHPHANIDVLTTEGNRGASRCARYQLHTRLPGGIERRTLPAKKSRPDGGDALEWLFRHPLPLWCACGAESDQLRTRTFQRASYSLCGNQQFTLCLRHRSLEI